MVYKFFGKKSRVSGSKNEIKENQQLANELHKPIIKKFKERKVYSSYLDNIWGADLADMQLISKFNKEFRFLLCVIDKQICLGRPFERRKMCKHCYCI